jgi:cytochrome c oxidase cbb3-type subunit 3
LILTLGYALVAAPKEAAREEAPSQSERVARPKAAQKTQARGREVYVSNCARCHGGDGRGQTTLGLSVEAPDMTDARWHARRGTRRMTQAVARGRGQMPAFAGKLTKAEIAAAVAYVRTLRK